MLNIREVIKLVESNWGLLTSISAYLNLIKAF